MCGTAITGGGEDAVNSIWIAARDLDTVAAKQKRRQFTERLKLIT